jgi:hypothetical protein
MPGAACLHTYLLKNGVGAAKERNAREVDTRTSVVSKADLNIDSFVGYLCTTSNSNLYVFMNIYNHLRDYIVASRIVRRCRILRTMLVTKTKRTRSTTTCLLSNVTASFEISGAVSNVSHLRVGRRSAAKLDPSFSRRKSHQILLYVASWLLRKIIAV